MQLLLNPKAHPVRMVRLLDSSIPEWREWEYDSIARLIWRKTSRYPDAIAENKLQALLTLFNQTEICLTQWEVFLPLCQAFSNNLPDFDELSLPTLAQMYNVLGVLGDLLDVKDHEWGGILSDEVNLFFAGAMKERGMYVAVGPWAHLQPVLSGTYYKCPDCGNEEYVYEDHDGHCDQCNREWHRDSTGTVLDTRKKTRILQEHDPSPVKKKLKTALQDWGAFKPDEDDPVDVQVVRLVDAIQYMQKRKKEAKP